MIEITSLTKTYGSGAKAVHAFSGIDLQIGAGMFGLLGPNGAGKTTFMRILAGIVNRSGGSVRVNGQDIATENSSSANRAPRGSGRNCRRSRYQSSHAHGCAFLACSRRRVH